MKKLTNKQYLQLKQMIIEANPEIKCDDCPECGYYNWDPGDPRKIKLADVLIAMIKSVDDRNETKEETKRLYTFYTLKILARFDLWKNSLEEQNDNTKALLYDILVKDKRRN